MRNAFIDELMMAAERTNNVALVVGDLGYGVVEPFAEKFPHLFFNSGVAEQNMMGMAAGLASEGFHVFVYSIANFPTFRCAEQVRNDVDYHQLPVTVVAVGGGLAYGSLGYSHHAVQDYALMRVMPNMLIAAPGDHMEVRACMRYLIQNPGPSYLRLGKAGERCIHPEVPLVAPGQWLNIHHGESGSGTYLTTGATLELVHRMFRGGSLVQKMSLHSLPLWNIKSKAFQAEQLARFTRVITVEDHLTDGGFGSWLLEALSSSHPALLPRVVVKALAPKICGMVAKQSTLNFVGGLNEDELLKW